MRALEDKVPRENLAFISEKDLGGIIILGGSIEGGEIAIDRGEISIYSSAERVTKAFELIRKYPDLPFIFSGFSGRITSKGISEADAFKQLIREQGLADRAGYYENVVFMKPMILEIESGKPAKPWLLITSASHMYR